MLCYKLVHMMVNKPYHMAFVVVAVVELVGA